MEELFLPYNEAIALRELGFYENCLGCYIVDKTTDGDKPHFRLIYKANHPQVLTPIYSQAFKFFREKYNAHHSISRLPQGALDADAKRNNVLKKYAWYISKDSLNPSIPNNGNGKEDTYEKAELECLKELIKIVKEN